MRPAFLPFMILFLACSSGAQSPYTYKGWEMKVSYVATTSSVGQGTVREHRAGRNEEIVVFRFEAKRLDATESVFVKDFRVTDDSGKQYGTDLLETFLYKGKKHHSAELPFTVPKGTKLTELRLIACPHCEPTTLEESRAKARGTAVASAGSQEPAAAAEVQEVTFQFKKAP